MKTSKTNPQVRYGRSQNHNETVLSTKKTNPQVRYGRSQNHNETALRIK